MFKKIPGPLPYPNVEDYYSKPYKEHEDLAFAAACKAVDEINAENWGKSNFRQVLCNILNSLRFREMVNSMVNRNPNAKCAFKACNHKEWMNLDAKRGIPYYEMSYFFGSQLH